MSAWRPARSRRDDGRRSRTCSNAFASANIAHAHDRGLAGRRAQARRHRHGGDASAQAAAARRADQRRRRRREVSDDGRDHARARAAADATVLFVEHDMEIVGRYAERVLAFYDGPRHRRRHAEPRCSATPRCSRYVTGAAPLSAADASTPCASSCSRWRCCAAVSLTVPPASMVGLVGRNGAGKTTLMRARRWASSAPARGRISFAGQDLIALPTHAAPRSASATCPRTAASCRSSTVEENILVPVWATRAPDADEPPRRSSTG